MTRGRFHHPFARDAKTWARRLTFIGGAAALAFAATTHCHTGVADAQTRSGETRAEDTDYVVTLSWAGTYTAGKQGTVILKVVPKTPYKVDVSFPTKFVLSDPPSKNTTYAKKKLEKADGTITDSAATFNVPFTGTNAGKATIVGKLHFKVCTDKCNTHNIDMSLSVDVAAAPKP